ncbi:MAG: hypothetical protein GXO74_01505 [Calditrichaeota bacterium]|nr:hypothetical protein [Calditrichota bacterium]
MPRSGQEEDILAVQNSEKLVKELRGQIKELQTLQKKQQTQIRALESKIARFPDLSKFSPEKLRQELIEGIRLLGERVTQAVQEINRRHEDFSEEIARKFEEIQTTDKENISRQKEEPESGIAPLKESRLLNEEDFEIVPRDAIQRLIELSRQQAAAVKKIIDEQEQKVADLEKKIEGMQTAPGNSSPNGNSKQISVAIILSLIALLAAIVSLVYQLF